MLAVLAAFFCLFFFAAAKKSRCRPAQGRRMNGRHRNADASENTSKPNQRRRHQQTLHQAARATGAADALNNTGPDFEVGVLHTSATLFNGTSGLVSG